MLETRSKALSTTNARSVLHTVARIIAADRRPVILATDKADILLSNTPANRLGLDERGLHDTFNWPGLCARAHRAGSIPVSATHQGAALDGELVYLPIGQADAYMLRLAENNQEGAMLRNRARTATLMRVSHDLRTPIQSLLATTEAVFQDAGSPATPTSQPREKMHRIAKQALDHIDNVLRVIQGELTASDLQLDEEFSLIEELEAVLEMIEPIAKARGARVMSTRGPGAATRVFGPVRFVRALLQNVIDNSVKHGGDTISVHLLCTPQESNYEAGGSRLAVAVFIEVSDMGGGLPPAQKARLKRALGHVETQGQDATIGREAPDGRPSAGLNVLAHALRQLGGHMDILDRGGSGKAVKDRDEKVVGTIFRVSFTLGSAMDATSPEPAVPPLLPTTNAQAILDGIGVLVVEDSPSTRDWLAHILRAAGADVQIVENGIKALKILRQPESAQRIHLLLSDMTLPHMSGVDLVRRITSAQSGGELAWNGKILGLTAHVDDTLRAVCLKLGMAQLLEKPIHSLKLCQAVRDAIRSGPPTTDTQGEVDFQQVIKPSETPKNQAGSWHDEAALRELTEQLGLEGAQRFMRRALGEARSVWSDLNTNGIQADTGRMLHAATGACGLTGLKQVERCLRRIEQIIETAKPDLAAPMAALQEALVESEADINGMAPERLSGGASPTI